MKTVLCVWIILGLLAAVAYIGTLNKSTCNIVKVNSIVIDDYLEWHNTVLGYKTKPIKLEDLQKFISLQAVLIINNKIIARNAQEWLAYYNQLVAERTRSYFVLPLTEKIIKEDTVIIRYTVKLVKDDNDVETHLMMGYAQVNSEGKITKLVEVLS